MLLPCRMVLIGIFALSPSFAGLVQSAEATFQVTFEDLWNSVDHPLNYPLGAHFSPVVGTTHNSDISFWSRGVRATTGVENVAERGLTTAFRNEVSAAVDLGDALPAVVGSNVEIAVSDEFPLATFLTMVAPTPDWFVGVHDYDLRSPTGLGFVESQVFEFTSYYDAGTEEGTEFSLNNPETIPQGVITLVEGVDAVRVFVDPDAAAGTTLPPIARLTFTRTAQTIPEPSAMALAAVAVGSGLLTRRIHRR